MNSTIERLLSLKVSDAMTENVISVSSNSTMSEAAHRLRKNRVSGAPVVDEMGHCVGVLSGSDYIRDKADSWDDYPPTHILSKQPVNGMYYSEELLHDSVKEHMSPAVQTIEHDCSLLESARCMCNEHIHRLIVLDHCVPVGIVSSLDLIAAFVTAVEE